MDRFIHVVDVIPGQSRVVGCGGDPGVSVLVLATVVTGVSAAIGEKAARKCREWFGSKDQITLSRGNDSDG